VVYSAFLNNEPQSIQIAGLTFKVKFNVNVNITMTYFGEHPLIISAVAPLLNQSISFWWRGFYFIFARFGCDVNLQLIGFNKASFQYCLLPFLFLYYL